MQDAHFADLASEQMVSAEYLGIYARLSDDGKIIFFPDKADT
jgi:hypothetical protein